MTVLPVLLAVSEFRERYQGGELSGGVGGGLGWLKEVNRGGAEAGRVGGVVRPDSDLGNGLRLREGGESRVVFIGVAGGVLWGVVGVAGWSTIARVGETSKGVTLGPFLGGLAMSSSVVVREQRQEMKRMDGIVADLLTPLPKTSACLPSWPRQSTRVSFPRCSNGSESSSGGRGCLCSCRTRLVVPCALELRIPIELGCTLLPFTLFPICSPPDD